MPTESLKARAAMLYGVELEADLLEVDFALGEAVRLTGVLVSPTHLLKAAHRDMQLFYINGRYVLTPVSFKNALKAVCKVFSQQAPVYALHLQLPPQHLDVNLAPDKMDVRILKEKELSARMFEELEALFKAEKAAEPLPVLKRKQEDTGEGSAKRVKVEFPNAEAGTFEERMAQLTNIRKTPAASTQPTEKSGPRGKASPAVPLPQLPAQQLTPVKHMTSVGAQRLSFLQESFQHLTVLGQFNKGFVIALLPPNSLFIIDQHAADEKATFEDLMRNTEVHKQPLVVPQTLHLPMDQVLLLAQHTAALEHNGFKVALEDGENGKVVKLLTKPLSKFTVFDAFDFQESVEHLKNNDFITDEAVLAALIRPSKFRNMFASRACRQSVMIGTSLEMTKMQEIVRRLSTLDKPWNCPHGRPTIRHLHDLDLFPTPAAPPNFHSLRTRA